MKSLRQIAPDYPRIPHLDKSISQMTHDDILSNNIQYPIVGYVQEKIDGSNMGVSWYDNAPVIRNRNNILKKGYSKIKTPAKQQFKSAWNWVHDHKYDIQNISDLLMSDITIFGDWMFAYHSVEYNKLPDWFIAYDIWVVEDNKFLSPSRVDDILSKTNIKYIKPYKAELKSVQDVITWSELESDYTDNVREGIVIKTEKNGFMENSYKVVNKFFKRRDDFNDMLIKNKRVV